MSNSSYLSLLTSVQDNNLPRKARFDLHDKNVYEIDLETRIIKGPNTIGVIDEHRAEIVYFKMARYHQNVDMTNMVGIVEYKNAKGESRIFAIPYYDVDTFAENEEVVFPWLIDKGATKKDGTITYSFKFYKINDETTYSYILKTQSATTKIINSLVLDEEAVSVEEEEFASYLDQLIATAQEAAEKDLYWITL